MKMTVSVNNDYGTPYLQYGTDRQKAKAAKFANADNKDLTKLAYKINDRKYRDSKFASNIAKATMSLPLIGAAVVAATTKGKVSARTLAGAKSFAKTAGAMGVGIGVLAANNAAASKSPKLDRAERKHPILTMAGLTALATGTVTALAAGAAKVSPKAMEKLTQLGKKIKLDKVAAQMDKAPEAVKGFMSKVAAKVSLPKGVKENLSKIAGKIKVPQALKDGYNKVANAETTKAALNTMKKAGNAMLRNPVTTASAIIGAAIVGHVVKKSVETSQTKAKLKEAQLKTANQLIEAYANENESLKMANSKAAEALEKSQAVVAEDKIENEEK